MSERTYISIYELPDFRGRVLARAHIDLRWNHQKVWNKARRMMSAVGGGSFVLLEYRAGRNKGADDD